MKKLDRMAIDAWREEQRLGSIETDGNVTKEEAERNTERGEGHESKQAGSTTGVFARTSPSRLLDGEGQSKDNGARIEAWKREGRHGTAERRR